MTFLPDVCTSNQHEVNCESVTLVMIFLVLCVSSLRSFTEDMHYSTVLIIMKLVVQVTLVLWAREERSDSDGNGTGREL